MTSTTAQSRRNLERGIETRAKHSELHARVRNLPIGEAAMMLAGAITVCPDWLERKDVLTILRWCPYVEAKTAGRWMLQAGIIERRQLGQLTDRQRQVLARMLYEHGRRFRSERSGRGGAAKTVEPVSVPGRSSRRGRDEAEEVGHG